MSRIYNAEDKFLERARIALTNAQADDKIKSMLAEYTMDEARLKEGQEKYELAKTSWEQNKQETVEAKIASETYKKAYKELEKIFKIHREKTQLFFKKQPEILLRLGIQGNFPIKYREFFDKVKMYYQTILDNAEVQEKLKLMKVTPEVATETLGLHSDLLKLRAEYEKETGESQEATKSKNAALLELNDWMEDFDNVAKVAFYDEPQLLESLGIFVRS